MGNALEFILKLTDMLTPGMRQAAAIANTSATNIAAEFEKINSSGKRLGASVNELKARLQAINEIRNSTTIVSEFDAATRAARRLEDEIDHLENKGKRNPLASWVTGIAASVSAFSIGQQALAQQANAENQQIAFKVLTGSKQNGDALYGNIVKMADSTPYESADLSRAAKTMLGYGINQKQIMPDLQMLGDVAAAQDSPAEALQSLSLALGQIQAKGKLAGQETLQLINAGFNPLKEISDITGISVANLDKAQEKGAISADMVTLAFKHATGEGGKFHNMMQEQSQTLGGQWSTFMDGVHHKLMALGKIIEPVAVALMQFATALINGEPAALLIGVAVGALAIAIWGTTIATYAQATATAVLNAVMEANPIGLVIAALAALVAIVMYAWNHFGWFRGAIYATWEVLKGFGTMIKDLVVDRIKDMIKGITGIGETLYLFFTGQWKQAWETGKQAAKDLVGVDSINHAIENGKKMGIAAKDAYNKGVGEVAALKGAKAGTTDPTKGTGAPTDYKKGFSGLSSYDTKGKADSINQGGQRNITINIAKQIERLEVHVASAKEGAEQIAALIREEVRRVIYSLNGEAAN